MNAWISINVFQVFRLQSYKDGGAYKAELTR